MRRLIARVYDYSIDGMIATEDTEFFQFCRDLPDDPAEDLRGSEFYVADWVNATIAGGDLAEQVGRLRRGGDGYTVVHGGIGLWRSLARLDLLSSTACTSGLQLHYRRRR